jgi:hypothetical protein
VKQRLPSQSSRASNIASADTSTAAFDGKFISMTDDTEELTIGKARIRRAKGADRTLTMFYFRYNVEYFNGSLPQLRVHWADEIEFEGDSVHALFVPEEQTPRQESFIVISSKLKELDPFQYLCLLHEMVHVRLFGSVYGHPREFVEEFKRVLDENRWQVLSSLDEPLPR